jgi:S1-C subfamily serine protease
MNSVHRGVIVMKNTMLDRLWLVLFLGATVFCDGWPETSLYAQYAQNPAPAPNAFQPSLAVPNSPATPRNDPAVSQQPPAQDLSQFTPDERINILVYQEVNRSVVNINTTEGGRFLVFEVVADGEGSGSVLDRAGHILTNFHVVDGAREIRVTLYDGKIYDAKLVGGDIDSDVAVLKINAPPESLFPVTFGNSSQLLVGQRVFAIGNPFGLERTLTTGIVSSLNRSLPSRRNNGRTMKSIIQIDAAINPGNSGGPLLDSHARLIGMNTAIASKTGESAGVGFAVPVDTIARVVPQLIQNGRVRRPDSGIAKVLPTDRGLLIVMLTPNGAAERAGLQGPRIKKEQKRQGPFSYETSTVDRSVADTIVAVDGVPIKTADDFLNAIETKKPGDQTIITVIRGGQQQQIPLRLDAND